MIWQPNISKELTAVRSNGINKDHLLVTSPMSSYTGHEPKIHQGF